MSSNKGRVGVSLLSLLLLAGSVSAQGRGPEVSPKIIRILKLRLKPSDLDSPATRLRAKLDKIGGDADLFKVADDESYTEGVPMPGISRVGNSAREVMAVLDPTNEQESPRLTYWIGVVHGRVAAYAIPQKSDDMIGPVYGSWRRRGRYLVGVGYDRVYHQQKWFDAEIYVLRDGASHPWIVQRLDIEGLGKPFGFVSRTSLTLDCRQSTGNDYQTIQMIRDRPTCEKIWEFRHGRYVLARIVPIHDELWAIDRLMTAAAHHHRAVLNSMIPDAAHRKVFLRRLSAAISHEAVYGGFEGEPDFVSRRYPGYGIDLDVAKTKRGWVLRDIEVKHFKSREEARSTSSVANWSRFQIPWGI